MLLVGSDDGVYRLEDIDRTTDANPEKLLDSGRVLRVRQFAGIDGAFAATQTGLHHSADGGETWTNLEVPEEMVYAVGASRGGRRLYAGTKPARVFVSEGREDPVSPGGWQECGGFQDLPSRDDWRLPRHENLAQVRDLHADPAGEGRVVAGVEVGGVHVSEDGGESWAERRDGVSDDVHELHVVDAGEYVAATGFGLFHTTDAGQSWTRLDEGFDQRYFRSVYEHEGTIYAGAALSNSSTWDDADAHPQLFAYDGEALTPVEIPTPDETVIGITATDGTLVAATHRGTVLVDQGEGLEAVDSVPTPGDLTGRYNPLLWIE